MSNEIYMDETDEAEFEQDALANATAVLVWLKENKPSDEFELRELIELVSSADANLDIYGDRYGIRNWNDAMFIFGGDRMLIIQGNAMRYYMLDLLDGLNEEFNSKDGHAVWVAA